jgi:hypothetical protein
MLQNRAAPQRKHAQRKTTPRRSSARSKRNSNMRRAVHALVTEAEWERVSTERPCPVCGADRGCSTHGNSFVSCERISSQWPLTTGAWLHRVEPKEASTGGSVAGRPTRAPADTTRAPLTAALAGTRV